MIALTRSSSRRTTITIRSAPGSTVAQQQRNAPSRWRLRPAFRLTSAEASATRRAINLGRSVLGASRIYEPETRVKGLADEFCAICDNSFSAAVSVGRLVRSGGGLARPRPSVHADQTSGTRQKCTEPVAPSSGFPTDRRRSDCRSESHQPRTLRTRCIAHTRGRSRAVKAVQSELFANCEVFFSHRVELRIDAHALDAFERRKRAGHEGPSPQRIRRAGNAFVHLPDEPSASA